MAIEPTQNVAVTLSFRDQATGKFIKANNRMIAGAKQHMAAQQKSSKGIAQAMQRTEKATKNTTKQMDRMRILTQGLQRKIGILRNALLVFFFVLRPIGRALAAITDAARQQELALTKLNLAAAGSGIITRKQVKSLEDYAAALQKTTTYGDEQIMNAMAQVATFKMNEEQIRQVTPRLLDMSRGIQKLTGSEVDLQDIAKAVSKALNGDVGSLTRYGVVISDSVKKSKDFTKILAEIDKNYGGMSAAQMNYTDQTKQLGNVWGDLKEAMGEYLTKSPAILAGIIALKNVMEKIEKAIDNAKEAQNQFTDAWVKGMSSVINMGIIGYTVINTIGSSFRVVSDTMILVFANMTKVANAFKSLWNITTIVTKGQKEANKIWDELTESTEAANQAIADASKRIIDEAMLSNMEDALKKMDDVYSSILAKTMLVKIEMDRLFTKEIPQDITKLEAKMLEFGISVSQEMTRVATSMHQTFSNMFFDAMTRDFKSLEEYAKDFGRSLLRIMSEVIAKMLIVKAFGWTGKYLGVVNAASPIPDAPGGGFGIGDPGIPGGVGIGVGHSGGVVRRGGISQQYHNGGEVSATLLNGEGVLSRTGLNNLGADNLKKINQGQQVGGGNGNTILVFQLWDMSDVQKNMKTIINAFNQNMARNGSMRRGVQQYG